MTEHHECIVLCLTEHWKSNIQILAYNFEDYILPSAHCKVENIHGGTVIYVKKGMKWKERSDITSASSNEVFECAAVELEVRIFYRS